MTLCLLMTGTAATRGQTTSARGSKAMLETPYFYFDNPDGTIEAFPEYRYKDLAERMMSISSSKYAMPVKSLPEGNLKKHENIFNIFFGRQTRTTVFVFDGQESAKAAMMTTTIYSSTILGLWAAADEAMREQVKNAFEEANMKGTITRTAKDGVKMGQPEELMFNGHEGGHIVNRMDMSHTWLSIFAGVNLDIVFDMYFYYDEAYDKTVGVLFTYSETKEPEGRSGALVKAIGSAIGYAANDSGENPLANMFERRDMIEFFKQHFHLKKTAKCPTAFVGTAKEPKLDLCGDTIEIKITEIFGTPPEEPGDSLIHVTKGPDPPIIRIIDPGPPNPPNPPEKPTGGPRSAKKFGVIAQGFSHEIIDQPFVENDQYVYFMQPPYNDNAVLAVDKQTGELREAVPGKRKADRPGIISIGAHGKDLYLDVEGRGIVRYDGKDVTTSKIIGEVDRGFMDNYKKIVLSPNGRYLAYSGQNCHSYVYDLLEGNKLIKSFHDGFEDFLVTDDGDFFGVNNFRALVYRNNGNTDGDATNATDMSDLLKDHPATIRQLGDDIWLVGGSKVTKTAAKEFQWTETTTLTSGTKLQDGALAADASGFAYIGYDSAGNRFAEFTATGKTPVLTKKLATGINVERREPLTVEVAKNIFIDSNQNIWMIENTGTGFVVVYNPKGIVGLTALAGKFIKQKK